MFTDNQNVANIVPCGSAKAHLQAEALSIYNICCNDSISKEMEWIPRSQNDQADFLSRIYDPDDWGLSWDTFRKIDLLWGHIPSIVSRITLIQKSPDLILDIGIPVQKALMHLSWIGAGRIITFVLLFVLFPAFFYICPIAKLREHSLSHFGIELRFGR